MDDEFIVLVPGRQRAPLAELLSGQGDQYYALDETLPVGDGTTTIWADRLAATAPDTQTVLTYGKSNGWLDGRPAVIRRSVGKGTITYVGALVDDKVMKQLIDGALAHAQVSRDFRSEEHTSELQSLMRISYAVFCLTKKNVTHKK